MKYTIKTLPKVHPMMVRKFDPLEMGWATAFRDKCIFLSGHDLEVEEIGIADTRLSFDEGVVDQSGAVFELTTQMMMAPPMAADIMIAVFTSRRWRNHRFEKKNDLGNDMEWPTVAEPLLFIGNPYLIERKNGGIIVHRESSYLIKSGMQLQHEAENQFP